MKINSILCDHCKKELIEDTSYPHKFIIEVKCIDVKVNTTGMEYCVAMFPPIDKALHFCGKQCLRDYLKTN